jgi:hypothetical protein
MPFSRGQLQSTPHEPRMNEAVAAAPKCLILNVPCATPGSAQNQNSVCTSASTTPCATRQFVAHQYHENAELESRHGLQRVHEMEMAVLPRLAA